MAKAEGNNSVIIDFFKEAVLKLPDLKRPRKITKK
jgi:hypothetical protein